MNEEVKSYNDTKNELEANVAAFAYNKNCNILYVPDEGFGNEVMETQSQKDTSKSGQPIIGGQGLGGFMKDFVENDAEFKNESKASGKANIENTNLNFIIKMG